MTTSQTSSVFTNTPRDVQSNSSDSFLDSGMSGSEHGFPMPGQQAMMFGQRPLSASSDRSAYSTSSSGIGMLRNSDIKPEHRHRIFKTIYKQTRKREVQQQRTQPSPVIPAGLDRRDSAGKLRSYTSYQPQAPPSPYRMGSPKRKADSPKRKDRMQKIDPRGQNMLYSSAEYQNTSQSTSCYSSANSSQLLSPIQSTASPRVRMLQQSNSCPLPDLSFTDGKKLWHSMKLRSALPEYSLVVRQSGEHRHHQVTPKMRAVLIDWLIDVCQVYQLHRETLYLSLDYLSRFMIKSETTIKRQTLQLVGVTCLFIAAKLEEIYPPKCHEFAYVTDGACTVKQIRSKEIEICSILDWKLQPVTAQAWLTLFLQTEQFKKHNIVSESNCTQNYQKGQLFGPSLSSSVTSEVSTSSSGFVDNGSNQASTAGVLNQSSSSIASTASSISNTNRQVDPVLTNFQLFRYPQRIFIQMSQLLDSCMMDVQCVRYPYSILAASTIYHFSSSEKMNRCSGYRLEEIEPCVRWMSLHAEILLKRGLIKQLKSFKRVIQSDWHNIQTHENKLDDVLAILKSRTKKPVGQKTAAVPETHGNSSPSPAPTKRLPKVSSAQTPEKSDSSSFGSTLSLSGTVKLRGSNERISTGNKEANVFAKPKAPTVSDQHVEKSGLSLPNASSVTQPANNSAAAQLSSPLEQTIRNYSQLKI